MYHIILKNKTGFISNFQPNWNDDYFMIIFGLQYSTDGKTWINFEIEHL